MTNAIPKFRSHPTIFMRHGQTDWNVEGLLMGAKDIPLNQIGKEETRKGAEELKKAGIHAIYSSSLKRCAETAMIVSKALDAPVHFNSALNERCWGIYEGRPKLERPANVNPPGGETEAEFSARIRKAFSEIPDEENLLIVTHSGVIRLLFGGTATKKMVVSHAKPIWY